MPAKKLVSERQWEILLVFMTDNPTMARGSVSHEGSLAKTANAQKWRELSSTLNSIGDGCIKSPTQWREYWNNAKYSVRKKACARRQQSFAAGNGKLPKKFIHFTDKEERILSILGKMEVNGEDEDAASVEALYIPPPTLYETPPSHPPSLSPPPSTPSRDEPVQACETSRRDPPYAPDWILQMEERRMAVEERTARAFETIAAAMTGIQATLEAMRRDNR